MENRFSATDWVVFVITLVIPSCIGIYHGFTGGRQRTTREFLMADRKMSCLPVAVSILVSFQSAILILGAPAEMYTKGTQYYLYTFGQMLAVVMATILFVPLFYPLKMTSIYEYLELRFKSKAARLTGTIINNLSTLIYTGIASFSPSTALQAVSGFPDWASFILIGVICTFYTFMGGLKTIVWVDVFQAFIMLSGILAIVIKATIEVGGIDHIWKLNDEWDRINFWNFDPDPTTRHTFWALVIGGMINWAGTYGASQASIQRFSSLPTLRDAKRAVLMNCVGVFLLLTLACLSGISVFAFYADKGCDPLSHGDIKNSNQIIPYFVSDMLGYPGVPGLFIACLFCGALSSLSSNLSSMVAVTWEDVMKPYFKDKSEENKAWITRILVIVYGALGIGTTFLFKNLKGTVLQASLSFMGAAGGALNGLIMLGAFFPWANWKGAVAGSLSSYVITMWVGIGKYTVVGIKENLPFPNSTCESSNHNTDKIYSTMLPFNTTDHTGEYFTVFGQTSSSDAALNELSGLHQFYSLSYLWYSAFGMIIAFVVGLIVSFATGPTKPEDIDPKYMIPIFDRLFWCCLPNKILKFLRCGVDYDKEEIEDNEDIKTEATTIGSCSNMSALGSETFSYKF
ncbi:sodium-coupled monocarboxylate transporter 1-like [Mytilus galloprovincialis]|uniref:sodium-coupled monocarboxylate transporter 1-like n=1 Tax=Mytilus galloprovincialis TaxID=29158 RepID=UPI003F7B8C4B